jgi:hypothetical protein
MNPGIRWVEVAPTRSGYRVALHASADIGGEDFCDLVEFPPLDPEDEDQEFGQEIAITADALDALDVAESQAGAFRDRWVNQGIAQDEYLDFVRAGRPSHPSPDQRSG